MLILLFLLGVMSARCADGEERAAGGGRGGGEVFTFAGDVRDFAVVSSGSVYVVTRERLYHLNHTLSELQSRSQRGSLTNDAFQRVPEALVPEDGEDHRHPGENEVYFVVNLMVPFVENGTLVLCGETLRGCDYCELLDLKDVRRSVHMEKISLGSGPNDTFSGGLVRVEVSRGKTQAYILAAKRKYESCGILVDRGIYLHNTHDRQLGGIFSEADGRSPHIWTRPRPAQPKSPQTPWWVRPIKFELVDGFHIDSTIYMFSRIPSSSSEDGNGGGGEVRLVWLESKADKSETLKSLRGATLRCCEEDGGGGFRKRSFLRSSSVIVPPRGASRVLWAGVFAAARGGGDARTQDGANNDDTALAVFDISPRTPKGASDDDPHFCSNNCDKEWNKSWEGGR